MLTRFESATTNWVVTLPAGLAANQKVLIVLATGGNHTISSYPSGAQSPAHTAQWDPGDPQTSVFVYNAPASPPSSITITMGTAVPGTALAIALSGVSDTNTIIEWATANINSDNGNTMTVPSVTTTVAGSIIAGGCIIQGTLTSVAAPAGWTDFASGGSTYPAAAAAIKGAQPTPGASGTADFTYVGDLSWGTAWTVSLRPGITGNVPPSADAGSDQSDIEPFSTVTLSGSASDTDGTIASAAWTQTAGTPVTLSNPTGLTTTFEAPGTINGETLTFQLSATDDQGDTSTDTVHVTVLVATEFTYINGVLVATQLLTAN